MIAGFFAGMQPPPVTVSTIEVEPITWKPGLEAIGTAQRRAGRRARRRDRAASSRTILFEANDEVEAGQHLAQIDDAIERADLAAAQAELDLAETQLERAQELRERGVTAINDLDVAQADASSARSQVVKLTAVMDQKSLEAPFGGIIGIPQVDVGAVRRCPAPSTRRCRTSTRMRVDFSVPEQQIRLIEIGMPVTVSTEVGDTELTGRITAIEPRIDPNSRLVTVRAEVDNPERDASTRASSCGPRRAARGAERDRAAADGAELARSTATRSSWSAPRARATQPSSTVEQVFVKAGRRSLGLVEIAEGAAAPATRW